VVDETGAEAAEADATPPRTAPESTAAPPGETKAPASTSAGAASPEEEGPAIDGS